MKSINIAGKVYELSEDVVWTGPDANMVEHLNSFSDDLMANYSASYGDSRAYVYNTVLERFPSIRVEVDDEKAAKPYPGVVY